MKKITLLITAIIIGCTIIEAQDSLYFYKSGKVISKNAIAKIDSITFYKTNSTIHGATVNDIDGNIYNTVVIGTQTWTVENLRTTRLNDGTTIPNVTRQDTWYATTAMGSCTYNNTLNPDTIKAYGRLYNYETVNTSKLCPTGWSVPTDYDWTTLTDYLGGETTAGGKLRESGTTHWVSPNSDATNSSVFTALPGGYRSIYGFNVIGYYAYWWSSTNVDTYTAMSRDLNESNTVAHNSDGKNNGFSIRCIRN